ncbi:2849_t:CDS:2, partial [Scutellospora calospora]
MREKFGYKGQNINFIEFENKEKEYYQQQLQNFSENKANFRDAANEEFRFKLSGKERSGDVHFRNKEPDKYLGDKGSQEEYVVNFKDIQYKHKWFGKKVIRKVGEEVPTSDQENKTLKELRQQAKEAINSALQTEPVISSGELSD